MSYHILMNKARLLTFVSSFSMLLSSCFFSQKLPDDYPFTKEKVSGLELFSGLEISLDSNSKTVKVSFDGFESSASKLDKLTERTEFDREVKNELGIKKKYETEYYFFEVKLDQTEKEEAANKLHEKILEATEGKDFQDAINLRDNEVKGIGLYVERPLCDGKPYLDNEFIYSGALLSNTTFYNGNTLFNLLAI